MRTRAESNRITKQNSQLSAIESELSFDAYNFFFVRQNHSSSVFHLLYRSTTMAPLVRMDSRMMTFRLGALLTVSFEKFAENNCR